MKRKAEPFLIVFPGGREKEKGTGKGWGLRF